MPLTNVNIIGEIAMLNNKMSRNLYLFCVIACLLSLLGCSKEKTNDALLYLTAGVLTVAFTGGV